MKKLLTLLLILLVIGVALIITKPSDEQCIQLFKSKLEVSISHVSNNNVLNSFLTFIAGKTVDKVKDFIRIDDKTFYKDVYLSDVKLGTAVFGIFIVDGDLRNNVNNISNTWDEKVNDFRQSTANKIKSVFRRKQQTNYIGNDLQTLQQELNQANYDLQDLKKFHFLRSKRNKQSEIDQKEQYIQELEGKIRELQNQN